MTYTSYSITQSFDLPKAAAVVEIDGAHFKAFLDLPFDPRTDELPEASWDGWKEVFPEELNGKTLPQLSRELLYSLGAPEDGIARHWREEAGNVA